VPSAEEEKPEQSDTTPPEANADSSNGQINDYQKFAQSSNIPSDDEVYEALHGYKPSESPEEAAKQILKDGLVSAAQQLVQLAENGSTERVRMESSKYVLEWNLGKPVGQSGLSDPWKELLGDIQTKDKAAGE
jgi:hypothetical protein